MLVWKGDAFERVQDFIDNQDFLCHQSLNIYLELKLIWNLRLCRSLGIIVALSVIKNIIVQLPVISEKPNNINLDNYKKNKKELKEEIWEDKPVNNSFELLGFINRYFYKVQMNYWRACLLIFLLLVLFCSSCSCQDWCCLVSLKWQGVVQ